MDYLKTFRVFIGEGRKVNVSCIRGDDPLLSLVHDYWHSLHEYTHNDACSWMIVLVTSPLFRNAEVIKNKIK